MRPARVIGVDPGARPAGIRVITTDRTYIDCQTNPAGLQRKSNSRHYPPTLVSASESREPYWQNKIGTSCAQGVRRCRVRNQGAVMSAYDLYGFGGFDRDVYDDRHMLLCDGRDCRTCDRADSKWDRMTIAELAAAHGLEVGE